MSSSRSNIVVEGKIIHVFDPREVPGKQQSWTVQDFVIEMPGGNKPKKLRIELWGEDRINSYDLEEGLNVKCFIDLESKESKDGTKWFTHIQAWKITWEPQPRRSWTPSQKD